MTAWGVLLGMRACAEEAWGEHRLEGRRVFVAAAPGFETLANRVVRGLVDVALGYAGVAAIVDLRGTADTRGRTLQATDVAIADELASVA